jgi:hypothetical protein
MRRIRRLLASNPGGEPPPQSPRPADSAEAEAPASHPAKSRPSRKKILTPIALALVGGALFLAAIVLYYSSPGEPSPVSYATLEMKSPFEFAKIEYVVSQVSSSVAEIYVRITLPFGKRPPPAKAASAKAPTQYFILFLPPGFAFRTCTAGFCTFSRQRDQYQWAEILKFKTVSPEGQSPTGMAQANFFVRAHDFGYASNGINALAAIPQVFYLARGSPTLTTVYENAPAASSYDWSSFPAESLNGARAVWDEPVTGGATQGRVAVGINHANQTKENNKAFFAGALIGLAGGALLSAVQEALHAND